MADSTVKIEPAKPPSRSAFWVALGIFLSRVSGLIRDRVFAHYLGNSNAAGAFRAALRIPNFLQNLFGEGVLSASFIPVYSRLLGQSDGVTAQRVARAVGAILAAGVAVLTLLGVFFTPAFVDIVAPGFTGETRALTVLLVRILFPGVGLLVLSAWCLGILNSHRRFFLSYSAPVVWNGAMIAALLYGAFTGTTKSDTLTIDLAWGSVIGSALQVLVQLPLVLRLLGGLKSGLQSDTRDDKINSYVRDIFRNSFPVFISRGVVQVSAYIDAMIASYLGPAAVASLAYAQTIYLLPVSLFGMSVAAAELPEMSREVHTGQASFDKLIARITASQKRIAFFVVPSAVAFIFLGRFVVQAIYQTGNFTFDDSLYVWYVLMGSAVGILASTWSRLYSSAFYALRDTRTPLKFALVRVGFTAGLGVLFAFSLRPMLNDFLFNALRLTLPNKPNIEISMGALGLTASAGLASYIEFSCLRWALGKKIGRLPMPYLQLAKIWVATLLSATLTWAAIKYIGIDLRFEIFKYDTMPLAWLALDGALYLVFTFAFGLDEPRQLLKKIR